MSLRDGTCRAIQLFIHDAQTTISNEETFLQDSEAPDSELL